jgi:hypothetical protein
MSLSSPICHRTKETSQKMLIKCSACKFQRLLHILEFLHSLIMGRKSLHDFIIISWMDKRAPREMSHFIIFSWRAPMLRIGIGYEHEQAEKKKKNHFKTQRAMNISVKEEKSGKFPVFHFNGF